MKVRLITALLGGAVLLLALVVSPVRAATMPGPGIVGNVEGGGIHVIQLFADNGDEVLDASDVIMQVKSTDSEGNFSFDNLDMDQGYFVIHNGQASPVQRIGEIKSYIDSFDITQAVSANPNTGFRINSAEGPLHSILGGVRDFYVDVLEGTAEAQLRSNPFSRTSSPTDRYVGGGRWHGVSYLGRSAWRHGTRRRAQCRSNAGRYVQRYFTSFGGRPRGRRAKAQADGTFCGRSFFERDRIPGFTWSESSGSYVCSVRSF